MTRAKALRTLSHVWTRLEVQYRLAVIRHDETRLRAVARALDIVQQATHNIYDDSPSANAYYQHIARTIG